LKPPHERARDREISGKQPESRVNANLVRKGVIDETSGGGTPGGGGPARVPVAHGGRPVSPVRGWVPGHSVQQGLQPRQPRARWSDADKTPTASARYHGIPRVCTAG
jgi:hypothetical protein